MLRTTIHRGLMVGAALTVTAVAAHATSTWPKVQECYNSGSFECAFTGALELLRSGKIVVGYDERTTDSMTFFQMSYVEAAARADAHEQLKMANSAMVAVGSVKARLPYQWNLAVLTVIDHCGTSAECREGAENLIYSVRDEVPPPSWRSLTDANPLSEIGVAYYEHLLTLMPSCEETS